MQRKRIIPDPLLMVIAILFITSFQAYWLVQNYKREEKSLTMKSEFAFRETVMQLQVSKLKLGSLQTKDRNSLKKRDLHVFMRDEPPVMNEQMVPKEEVITTINVIRDVLSDSLRSKKGDSSGVFISIKKTSKEASPDSIRVERYMQRPGGGGDQFFNLLYAVDSLQEPLRLSEIDSAFRKVLRKEKMNIGFFIIKTDSVGLAKSRAMNQVTVGLTHPVRYQLKLTNNFTYLVRQIYQPILFSILLLGITILAFLLLYKNLRRQKRLSEEKNEFISNITHELNTPIATVGVAIEALKNFNAIDDPQRTKEYLDISQNELKRLSLLVDKVLKLSMFESKDVELKIESVNLQTITEEVLSSLKLQLEKYQARVAVEYEGDLTIRGDRMHLQSVIFNLVDNALKYCIEKPEINIQLKETATATIISVADNGIGIAPEYRKKVFEKFYRIPHGDTHNAKGYGLGLSYVAQVIDKHKGSIELQTVAGKGTIFTILLPKQQSVVPE